MKERLSYQVPGFRLTHLVICLNDFNCGWKGLKGVGSRPVS